MAEVETVEEDIDVDPAFAMFEDGSRAFAHHCHLAILGIAQLAQQLAQPPALALIGGEVEVAEIAARMGKMAVARATQLHRQRAREAQARLGRACSSQNTPRLGAQSRRRGAGAGSQTRIHPLPLTLVSPRGG